MQPHYFIKLLCYTALALLFLACEAPTPKTQGEMEAHTAYFNENIHIAEKDTTKSMEDRRAILQELRFPALLSGKDSLVFDRLYKITLTYARIRDSLNFMRSNYEFIQLAEESRQHWTLGNAYWDRAAFFKKAGKRDSAIHYYKYALKNLEAVPVRDSLVSSSIGRVLYNMSLLQYGYKDYLSMESNLSRATGLFLRAEDEWRLYYCYNLLGLAGQGMKNWKVALYNYRNGMIYLPSTTHPKREKEMLITRNNIGNALRKVGRYDDARIRYERLLYHSGIDTIFPELKIYVMTSLADVYTWGVTQKIDQAQGLLERALHLSDSLGYWEELPRTLQYYANLKAVLGDTLAALPYAEKALALARQNSDYDRELQVMQLMARLHPTNALHYVDAYYALNDSLQQVERNHSDKYARVRMETNALIQKNEDLIDEKTKAEKAIVWLVWGIFVIFMVSIIVLGHKDIMNELEKRFHLNMIHDLTMTQEEKIEEGKRLEKERLSRELHDAVLGRMLGVRLVLTGLDGKEEEEAVVQRQEIIEEIHRLETFIRDISHELHEDAYEEVQEFTEALERLLEYIRRIFSVSCTLYHNRKMNWNNLTNDLKLHLYRILQECTKNSIVHGECNNIDVTLEMTENLINFTIADNGKGFDINADRSGIGLQNIYDRVKEIEGTIHISSAIGKGTTIYIVSPPKYITDKRP